MSAKQTLDRESLIKKVSLQIELSICLNSQQKDWLQKKLPRLEIGVLTKLVHAFEQETEKRDALLGNFFQQHPELYDNYHRRLRSHVMSTYEDIEKNELVNEEILLNDLLAKL